MKKLWDYFSLPVAVAIGATLAASPSFAQSVDTARIEAAGQNDWLTWQRFQAPRLRRLIRA